MNEQLTHSIKDAWSRDFDLDAAKDYVLKCVGIEPTETEVLTIYSELDEQFNEWCQTSA